MPNPVVIIETTQQKKLAELQREFPSGGKKCAWVKINQLYCSIEPITGNDWPQLINLRKNHSQRIVVYTGRHGDEIGCDTLDGLLYENYKERIFVDEDVGTAVRVLSTFPGILFSIRDAGKAPYTDILTLRKHIQKDLAAGHLVILAWCYSLLSMFELPVSMTSVLRNSYIEQYKQQSIAKLVEEGWHWV